MYCSCPFKKVLKLAQIWLISSHSMFYSELIFFCKWKLESPIWRRRHTIPNGALLSKGRWRLTLYRHDRRTTFIESYYASQNHLLGDVKDMECHLRIYLNIIENLANSTVPQKNYSPPFVTLFAAVCSESLKFSKYQKVALYIAG